MLVIKSHIQTRSIEILLVEDNPGDVRLIKEAFKDAIFPYNLMVAGDGQEAMEIIKHGHKSEAYRPNLIILDLNLPKKSGREVLKEIKSDEELMSIPVIILTTSSAKEDIQETYHNHVNAFITKPVDLDRFINIVKSIQDHWIQKAKLP